MAKICVLNTAVDRDSAGQLFDSTVPVVPAPPTWTKPVRLLNAEKCAVEFLFTGLSGSSFGLRWWLEFWGDDVAAAQQALIPTTRLIPSRVPQPGWAIDPDVPWSREVKNEVEGATSISGTISNEASPAPQVAALTLGGGGGVILNEPIERQTTLAILPDAKGIAVWVPVEVFAPWARIALYAPSPIVPGPTDIDPPPPNHLLINVHVGGHDEDGFLNRYGDRPYVYNASQGGQIL